MTPTTPCRLALWADGGTARAEKAETERDGAGHLPQAVTAREPAPTEMLGPPTLTGRERDVLAWLATPSVLLCVLDSGVYQHPGRQSAHDTMELETG